MSYKNLMKKLLLCLYLCSLSAAFCFAQEKPSYNIHLSPLLEQRKANPAEKPFNEALNTLVAFINTGSDSLLLGQDISKDQKSRYYQLFFLTNIPRNYSHYHILSVDSIGNGYQFKVITRQRIDEYKSDEILAIANIQVKNGLIDISYKNYLKDYTPIKKGPITYFIKDKDFFNSVEADKAVAFCDSLKNVLALKELHPLNYILSKKDKAPEIFGFDYFWSPYGCFMPNELLLSNGIGENYRHELVHYVLQDYKFDGLTSEGLAVWFGGSNGKSFKSFIAECVAMDGAPTKEQIKNVFTSTNPNMDTFKYRYTLPAICIDLIHDKKGIKGILQLLNNADKYYNLNALEVLKDISGENEERLIGQIFEKCTILKNK